MGLNSYSRHAFTEKYIVLESLSGIHKILFKNRFYRYPDIYVQLTIKALFKNFPIGK